MALRRGRDVNDVRSHRFQHEPDVGKTLRVAKSLCQLPSHQQLAIAHGHNLATWNAPNGQSMLVRDLAAPRLFQCEA